MTVPEPVAKAASTVRQPCRGSSRATAAAMTDGSRLFVLFALGFLGFGATSYSTPRKQAVDAINFIQPTLSIPYCILQNPHGLRFGGCLVTYSRHIAVSHRKAIVSPLLWLPTVQFLKLKGGREMSESVERSLEAPEQ